MQYMIHEKHGRMPVYSPTEIEVNQKNGWVLEVVPSRVESTPAKSSFFPQDAFIPRGNLIDAYKAKFGKNPHHRMKDETIKKALEGE